MPITKSAKKALRQNKRRRIRNLRQLDAMRENIKNIKKLISGNKKDEAIKLLPMVYKTIDKAAKTGVIKKNNAANKKSGIAKLLNKITAQK